MLDEIVAQIKRCRSPLRLAVLAEQAVRLVAKAGPLDDECKGHFLTAIDMLGASNVAAGRMALVNAGMPNHDRPRIFEAPNLEVRNRISHSTADSLVRDFKALQTAARQRPRQAASLK